MESDTRVRVGASPSPSVWDRMPAEVWQVYRQVFVAAAERGLPFALGGGFAFSYHAERWRDTKDIDLFVPPARRDDAIEIISDLGFHDYFDEKPYDRGWIYRGVRDGLIADIIWAFANYRTEVSERWMDRAPRVLIHDVPVPVLAAEELLWAKLHVMHRDRCDWPDLLNVLYRRCDQMDWDHLLGLIGEDAGLLGGLLATFAWICPGRAQAMPRWLWRRVGLAEPPAPRGDRVAPDIDWARVNLLEHREWFGPEPDRHPGEPVR